VEADAAPGAAAAVDLAPADRWIRSRLGGVIRTVERAFADYRFDFAATALYEFTWHEYCDWYLELAKAVLQDAAADAARLRGTRRTLLEVLEALLRVLHPLMPFITEEIWQRVAPQLSGATAASSPSLMLAAWPRSEDFATDAAAERDLQWLMQVVLGVRQIRGEMDISPARKLPLLLQNSSAADRELAQRHLPLLMRLAGVEAPQPLAEGVKAPPAAAAIVGELTLLVPMAGLIDPIAEQTRLEKQLRKTGEEIARAQAKLGNENFVRSAPAAVVEQERGRLAEFERTRSGLERQLAQVRALGAGPP